MAKAVVPDSIPKRILFGSNVASHVKAFQIGVSMTGDAISLGHGSIYNSIRPCINNIQRNARTMGKIKENTSILEGNFSTSSNIVYIF